MSAPATAADEATAAAGPHGGGDALGPAIAAPEVDPRSNHSDAAAAVGVAAAAAAAVAPAAAPVRPVYFERQSLSRCAVHTLNNLLQCRAFTPAALDALCRELTPNAFINPHKSLWGVGNYDVNVIMRALQTKGFTVNWFDRRKRQTDSTCENLCHRCAPAMPLTFPCMCLCAPLFLLQPCRWRTFARLKWPGSCSTFLRLLSPLLVHAIG